MREGVIKGIEWGEKKCVTSKKSAEKSPRHSTGSDEKSGWTRTSRGKKPNVCSEAFLCHRLGLYKTMTLSQMIIVDVSQWCAAGGILTMSLFFKVFVSMWAIFFAPIFWMSSLNVASPSLFAVSKAEKAEKEGQRSGSCRVHTHLGLDKHLYEGGLKKAMIWFKDLASKNVCQSEGIVFKWLLGWHRQTYILFQEYVYESY